MSKIRVGNKQNSFLNGEWAGHVRGFFKKFTSKLRRNQQKKITRDRVKQEMDLVKKMNNY